MEVIIDYSRKEWMHVFMRMMVVVKEFSTNENLWSFQHWYFMTSSNGALEKRWNNMRDCIAVKWVHLFGFCRLKEKRASKLGLLCGWENCESLIAGFFVLDAS
jgi:hypothetical protein